MADAGVEEAQVVVDLGDRPDGRARVAGGRLLVDGDGRREALDEVDVGLVHLAQELAGVGRERLDVAALALGVDGVEGQGGLARARQPGEDDQPVPGQVEGDVAEVVLAGPANDQTVGHPVEDTGGLSHADRSSPDRPVRTRCHPATGWFRCSAGHAHDRLVEYQGAGRPVEGGVAVIEDAAVVRHHPVTQAAGRRGTPRDS